MDGIPTEGALDGSALTSKYSSQTDNDCDRTRTGTATPQAVSEWLSEWTGEDTTVRGDGSVTLPSEALPLPSLDAATTLKSAGWRFDGYESHTAVYREVEQ